ncbi:hypothetical protein QBC37DRAFT_405642 [Rhypophila decipiens]|uniref:DUF7791 domain-containing protein n=1 Tax=Rhypophila decipiens TaxID=261697 RepID=A0AAN7B0D8_9PEZI|nr:hypothetical protein QBC37DRAFT_405642 [Rhypophila decipiens]
MRALEAKLVTYLMTPTSAGGKGMTLTQVATHFAFDDACQGLYHIGKMSPRSVSADLLHVMAWEQTFRELFNLSPEGRAYLNNVSFEFLVHHVRGQTDSPASVHYAEFHHDKNKHYRRATARIDHLYQGLISAAEMMQDQEEGHRQLKQEQVVDQEIWNNTVCMSEVERAGGYSKTDVVRLIVGIWEVADVVSRQDGKRFTPGFGSSARDWCEKDELAKHSRWRVVENDRRNGKTIVDEITTRAQGVFLWVFLVIPAKRNPSDLEKFFKQILESVEPFYHDKMAETLMIAAAGREPLRGAIYSFHDLSFDNKDYATQEKVVPWSFREFVEFMEPFSRRLSSRTKGLLEVNSLERVDFLHRTVRDFLRTSDMMKYLAQKARTRFDPSLAIFQGYICWIKHARFLSAQEGFFLQATQTHLSLALEEALSYASDSDEYKNPFDTFVRDLIDDLEFSIQNIFSKCILRLGLGDYWLKKMAKMPGFLDDLEVPPLALILRVDDRRKATDSIEWTARRINLLRALLERKHDPNQTYHSPFSRVPTTAWCEYIRQLIPYPSLEDETLPVDYPCGPFVKAVSKGVFLTLLEFGADPNGLVEDDSSPEPLPIWAKFFLACFSARDVAQHGDIYLKNLETIMRAADLEALTGYLQPLGQWILGQDADALSQSIGIPVTFQAVVWNILQYFLGQLSKLQPPRVADR